MNIAYIDGNNLHMGTAKAQSEASMEQGEIMHHKRGRARNRRAGCKMCKPWKVNGVRNERADGEGWGDHKRREALREDLRSYRKGA